MRNVGLTHEQMSRSINTGSILTNEIRQHEARDKLVILILFCIFVLTSIIIVVKRIYNVLHTIVSVVI